MSGLKKAQPLNANPSTVAQGVTHLTGGIRRRPSRQQTLRHLDHADVRRAVQRGPSPLYVYRAERHGVLQEKLSHVVALGQDGVHQWGSSLEEGKGRGAGEGEGEGKGKG